MKKEQKALIYHPDAKIICACGKQMTFGSTRPEIHVELCSNCHPYFTGKDKVMDTAGRVDRFKKLSEKKVAGTKQRKMQTRFEIIRKRKADAIIEEKTRIKKIKAAKSAAKTDVKKATEDKKETAKDSVETTIQEADKK